MSTSPITIMSAASKVSTGTSPSSIGFSSGNALSCSSSGRCGNSQSRVNCARCVYHQATESQTCLSTGRRLVAHVHQGVRRDLVGGDVGERGGVLRRRAVGLHLRGHRLQRLHDRERQQAQAVLAGHLGRAVGRRRHPARRVRVLPWLRRHHPARGRRSARTRTRSTRRATCRRRSGSPRPSRRGTCPGRRGRPSAPSAWSGRCPTARGPARAGRRPRPSRRSAAAG